MMRINNIFFTLFLFSFQTFVCQKKSRINFVEFNDSSLMINNVILYQKDVQFLDNIDTLKKNIPKERIISAKEDNIQRSYYYVNSGIEFVSTINKKDLISFNIHYVNLEKSTILVNWKLKPYSGILKIKGIDISSKTTLGDFKKMTNCEKNIPSEIAFKCDSNLNCYILFDGAAADAKILSVHFGL